MTDTVIISVVTSTTAAITATVGAYFAYRAKAVASETHVMVNSRLTQLLEISKASEHAKGKLEGVVEGKAEQRAATDAMGSP